MKLSLSDLPAKWRAGLGGLNILAANAYRACADELEAALAASGTEPIDWVERAKARGRAMAFGTEPTRERIDVAGACVHGFEFGKCIYFEDSPSTREWLRALGEEVQTATDLNSAIRAIEARGFYTESRRCPGGRPFNCVHCGVRSQGEGIVSCQNTLCPGPKSP